MSHRERAVNQFERWGPAAFVLGGVGLLGTSVFGSLHVVGVLQSPPWLAMGPLLFGLWFVFVGLVGLYPQVRDAARRLSLVGVWTGGVGWIVWTGTLFAAIVVDLTSNRTFADPGSWAPPLLAVGFVLALLSFLGYGLGSTRSDRLSQTLGVLLLVPVVAFLGQAVLLTSKILTGEVVAILQLAFGGAIGLALVGIGYRLRPDDDGVDIQGSQAQTRA